MPIVHIYAFDRSVEAKRKAVRDVTRVLAEAYELPETSIIVKIRNLNKDGCAHGGVLVSDREAQNSK
jgi:4-oxalocrotonate tautomerase family enzyme